MTPTIYHAAAWEAMSDQQKVEWLATEVMGWRKWYWNEPAHGEAWGWVSAKHSGSHKDKNKCDAYWQWNPVGDYEYLGQTVKGDWNHWRQVEEKFVGNWHVLPAYFNALTDATREQPYMIANDYMTANLPTRAKALYLAFHSLPHSSHE